jgi:hypothetical protein
MHEVRDFGRIGPKEIYGSGIQQRHDLRVPIKTADRLFLDRVLTVVERPVPVPIFPRASEPSDNLPCLACVFVAIAAFDAAIAHAERLAVDTIRGGEFMWVERRVRLQNDFGVAARRRGRGTWSDSGVGWMMNRVSCRAYKPVTYACQSALI